MMPRTPARRRRSLPRVALGLVVLVAVAGCTGPVRSEEVYAAKAAATAEAASDAGELQRFQDGHL